MTEREAFETWCASMGFLPTQARYETWQAACAWQREKDAGICDGIATDKWSLYKGRPPYTGTEPGRAADYTQGQSDGADQCADKIRSAE